PQLRRPHHRRFARQASPGSLPDPGAPRLSGCQHGRNDPRGTALLADLLGETGLTAMDEALHAVCLSAEPTLSAEVTAAMTHLPGFSVRMREADYQLGLKDLRDPDLVVVILGIDPTPGLNVIEDVLRAAPSTRVLALSRDENPE